MRIRTARLIRRLASVALAAALVVASVGAGWRAETRDCDQPCCAAPADKCCSSPNDAPAARGCPCEMRPAPESPRADAVMAPPLLPTFDLIETVPVVAVAAAERASPCIGFHVRPRIRAPDSRGHPLRAPPSL